VLLKIAPWGVVRRGYLCQMDTNGCKKNEKRKNRITERWDGGNGDIAN
jgi:hypothetical protein